MASNQINKRSSNEIQTEEELAKSISDENESVELRIKNGKTVKINLNSDDESEYSNHHSVTSTNSLGSLLREKLQRVPVQLRQKPPNLKLKLFMLALFIVIIFMVCTVHILYYRKILQLTYFDSIKFNQIDRIINIYDVDGFEALEGILGISLNTEKGYPCLPEDMEPGAFCWEWMSEARIYLRYFQIEDVNCFNIHWISIEEGVVPTDCFKSVSTNGINNKWYGAVPRGYGFAPVITGSLNDQYGNAIRRYLINSNRMAVTVNETTPLYLKINKDNALCLQARHDNFAFVSSKLPELNYNICTSSNMFNTHVQLNKAMLWNGSDMGSYEKIKSFMEVPLWTISLENQTDESLINLSKNLNKFDTKCNILLDENWQKASGDFEIDQLRFKNFPETLEFFKKCHIFLSIQPFISTESKNFAELVQKELLIFERGNSQYVPALTRYKRLNSCGVLDISNNKTSKWLMDKLKKLRSLINIKGFFLDTGSAHSAPFYAEHSEELNNPDEYNTKLTELLNEEEELIGVNFAAKVPKAPTFLMVPDYDTTWGNLQKSLQTFLEYTSMGYPLLTPAALQLNNAHKNFTQSDLSELYKRWLQVSIFLPVIKFNINLNLDPSLATYTKAMLLFRDEEILPVLQDHILNSLNNAIPLIRPLWMLDPDDPSCHEAEDEFAVGNKIIVAPILTQGSHNRNIYLPKGIWKDGTQGRFIKGQTWLKGYEVQENKIAYFMRIPDDKNF